MNARGGGIPTADHVFDARHIINPQTGARRQLTGLATVTSQESFEIIYRDHVMNCVATSGLHFLNVPLHIEVTFCSLTYHQDAPLIDHLRMAKGWTFPLHKAALEGLDARLRKEVMASEGAKELFEKASACQGATKARVTKTKR